LRWVCSVSDRYLCAMSAVYGSPLTSRQLTEFASAYGPPIRVEAATWQTYLAPSFSDCENHWKRLKGAQNAAGDVFDFEIALIEKKALPNALCGYSGDRHCILVYHTLPMFLLEFFCRLLCHKNVLPWCGDPSNEVSWSERGFNSPPGFGIINGEAKVGSMDDVMATFGPKCLSRTAMALKLYRYAMQYVLEHEMGHAFNGHVHYAKANLGLSTVDEHAFRIAEHSSDVDRLIYCFLESQADKGSYYRVVSFPTQNRMHTPYQTLSSQDESVLQDTKARIFAGAFLAVYWMITDVVTNSNDLKSYSAWTDHPSSLARALAFVLMPLAQQESLPPEVGFFVRRAVEEASQELIELANTIGYFRPFRFIGREDMYDEVYRKNTLQEPDLNAVMEQLQRYRYSIAP
jgi:hypothetical protein